MAFRKDELFGGLFQLVSGDDCVFFVEAAKRCYTSRWKRHVFEGRGLSQFIL